MAKFEQEPLGNGLPQPEGRNELPTGKMKEIEVQTRFTIRYHDTNHIRKLNHISEQLELSVFIGADTEKPLKKLFSAIDTDILKEIVRLGPWRFVQFYDKERYHEHLVVIRGEITTPDPLLTRIHSSYKLAEIFYSQASDDRVQLDTSLLRIRDANRGMIIWLDQEGAGAGLATAVAQLTLTDQGIPQQPAFERLGVPKESRNFQWAIDIIKLFVPPTTPIQLMTENENKRRPLREAGIKVIHDDFHVTARNKTQEDRIKNDPAKVGEQKENN